VRDGLKHCFAGDEAVKGSAGPGNIEPTRSVSDHYKIGTTPRLYTNWL
jgi:hypothetical protein